MNLNEEQKKALNAKGNVLIYAGPGTGKTTVIAERAKKLINEGKKVLCLTFSEKAAQEMTSRIGEEAFTFHSFSYRLLEEHKLLIGRPLSVVLTKRDQLLWLYKNIDKFNFSKIKFGNKFDELLEAIIDTINFIRENDIDFDSLSDERFQDIKQIYLAYEDFKKEKGLIDYSDMVSLALKFISDGTISIDKFDELIIDEFQDTNLVQLKLIKLLANNVFAVGDDDQSIYKFRGAKANIFDIFKQTFSPTEIVLTQDYRNTKQILEVANRIISEVKNRKQKKLLARSGAPVLSYLYNSESDIIPLLKKLLNQTNSIAILTRRQVDGFRFYEALRRASIPCSVVGFNRFVNEVSLYLSVISNLPYSGVELNEIMRLYGIDDFLMQLVNKKAKEFKRNKVYGDGVWKALLFYADNKLDARISALVKTLTYIKNTKEPLSSLVYSLIFEHTDILKRAYQQNAISQLNKIVELATTYEKVFGRDLDGFAKYLLTETVEDEVLGKGIEIMTVHQAKGKEWDVVLLGPLNSGKFPLKFRKKQFSLEDDEQEKKLHIDEEKRIFYVGATRARDQLILIRSRQSNRSSFINKLSDLIKDELLQSYSLSNEKEDFMYKLLREKRYDELKEVLSNIQHYEEKKELEIPKDFTFSASKIKTYNNCPAQFKYSYILNIPSKPKTYFSLGKAVHAVAEFLGNNQELLDRKKAYEVFEQYWDLDAYPNSVLSKEDKEKARAMIDTLFDWFLTKAGKTITVEKSFEIKIGNVIFKGFIDRIEEKDGDLHVIDFKTGNPQKDPIDQDVQLAIYALAVKELYGKYPKTISLFYLAHNEMQTAEVKEENISRVVDSINETIINIFNKNFEKKKSILCDYCDYRSICELD